MPVSGSRRWKKAVCKRLKRLYAGEGVMSVTGSDLAEIKKVLRFLAQAIAWRQQMTATGVDDQTAMAA